MSERTDWIMNPASPEKRSQFTTAVECRSSGTGGNTDPRKSVLIWMVILNVARGTSMAKCSRSRRHWK